jgi:hypothetical protein
VGVVQNQYRDGYSQVNQLGSPPPQQPVGSKPFLVVISAVLGALISTGTIISVLGKAFYVDRSEYNVKVLKDAEDKITVQQTLDRLNQALTRQEAAFEKLSDRVERIKTR